MAVAVLSDDADLFSKASSLFMTTTTNYLRWGRDPNSSTGRTLGECTETLRVCCTHAALVYRASKYHLVCTCFGLSHTDFDKPCHNELVGLTA